MLTQKNNALWVVYMVVTIPLVNFGVLTYHTKTKLIRLFETDSITNASEVLMELVGQYSDKQFTLQYKVEEEDSNE